MKIRVAVEVAASKPLEVMEVDDGEHAGIRLRQRGQCGRSFLGRELPRACSEMNIRPVWGTAVALLCYRKYFQSIDLQQESLFLARDVGSGGKGHHLGAT
jgi:hypothetical protein